ncbi:MAG TPA: FHA domain-containing protein [Ktedonobacterales bacterium]|jgi:pSer/pThr/pTyr-binding forkhead associated (FHA) protein
MGELDFPTWLAVGSYGGLTFSLLVAVAIASYALRQRRGTRRQLARAMLVFLAAGCLMFLPIWWTQNRFGLLGPTLSWGEVAFWLAWAALIGWSVPLGTALGFFLLAGAQPATGRVEVPAYLRAPPHVASGLPFPVELSDPRRLIEPLGAGQAWGRLVPADGPFAQRPLLLTRQVTLVGREADCDIVVVDQLTSRHHAELRWERGRVCLVDRGSMNGSRVNGQGVMGQAPLRHGDVVEIGEQRYRFEQLSSQPNLAAVPGLLAADEETHKLPGIGRAGPATVPATPALVLIASGAAQPGMRWELNSGVIKIGRDNAHEICLPDPSVSRLHAQIIRQATGFYLHDLTSQNGTLVNGQFLQAPVRLQAGDLVQFGTVPLRCEALPLPASLARGGGDGGMPAGAGWSGPAAYGLAPGARPGTDERATPPRVASAQNGAGGMPRAQADMHTRMGSPPAASDRPHLGPPRLLPTQPPEMTPP